MARAAAKPPPFARDVDDILARIRVWTTYTETTPRALARIIGGAESTIRNLHDPARFNPTIDTVRKLQAAVPPDFDAAAAIAEYREAIRRVRAWFKWARLKRYELKPDIQYDWVRDIASPDWSPAWFHLRKILARIPADFDHLNPPRRRPRKKPIRRSTTTDATPKGQTDGETRPTTQPQA